MIKKLNSFTVLLVATILMVLLMLMTIYRSVDDSESFTLLFPGLYEELSDVDTLEFTSEQGEFTLKRDGEDWLVTDHYNYPADYDLVKRMLVDLTDAKILEDKTDDPEQHHVLGLQDSDKEGSESVEVVLKNGDDTIAGLIRGDARNLDGQQTGPQQFYARRSGENESWLVEGYLQFSPLMLNWIDGEIVNVARERIARVDITQPDGATATLVNLGEKDQFGTPESGPETTFKYEQLGYDIAGSLNQMRLEDVIPREDLERQGQVVEAEFLTYDGLKITTRTSFEDGEYFTTLAAKYDDVATDDVPSAIAETDALKSEDAVRDEVSALNEQFEQWAYRLSGFVGTNLMREKADIVTTPEQTIPMPAPQ